MYLLGPPPLPAQRDGLAPLLGNQQELAEGADDLTSIVVAYGSGLKRSIGYPFSRELPKQP